MTMKNELEEIKRLKALVLQALTDVNMLERKLRDLDSGMPREESASAHAAKVLLATDDARRVMTRLQEAGVLDNHLQPLGLSAAEQGLLAHLLAVRLGVNHVWKVFAGLWGRNPSTLRTAYNHGLDQRKSYGFLERMNEIVRSM